MKNILVVDVAASVSGGAAILKQFFDYVCRYGQENRWLFLTSVLQYDVPEESQKFVQIRSFPHIKKSPFSRIFWEMKDLRKIAPDFQPDIVFSLQNVLVHAPGLPQYIYMHQSLPFQDIIRFSFLKKTERTSAFQQRVMGALIRKSIKKAKGVVVQTQWVKDGVLKKTNIPADKVLVTPPSVDAITVSRTQFHLQQYYMTEKAVLFYPAISETYKNHLVLLEALRILKAQGMACRLILTANLSIGQGPVIKETAERYGLDVVSVGYLSQIDVYELLLNSVMVFPSYIETVGLPLVEAQSFGIPIAVSDCPYSHNVCDGYDKVCFFDYTSPEDMADKIQKVIRMPKKEYGECISMTVPERFVDTVTWKKVTDFITGAE